MDHNKLSRRALMTGLGAAGVAGGMFGMARPVAAAPRASAHYRQDGLARQR
jgi:hypothetical protein